MLYFFQSAASLSGGSDDGTNHYDGHHDEDFHRVSHSLILINSLS